MVERLLHKKCLSATVDQIPSSMCRIRRIPLLNNSTEFLSMLYHIFSRLFCAASPEIIGVEFVDRQTDTQIFDTIYMGVQIF